MKMCVLLILLGLLVFAVGCAQFGTYMKDRGNDFADCFTVRCGTGYGLGVRTQVTNYFRVSAGVGSYAGRWVGCFGREKVDRYLRQLWVGEPFTLLFVTEVRIRKGFDWQYSFLGVNEAEFSVQELYQYPQWSPYAPFIRRKFFIEVGATLLLAGFDLGFNPAELLDFLLGWFTIDIADDDAGARAARDKRGASMLIRQRESAILLPGN